MAFISLKIACFLFLFSHVGKRAKVSFGEKVVWTVLSFWADRNVGFLTNSRWLLLKLRQAPWVSEMLGLPSVLVPSFVPSFLLTVLHIVALISSLSSLTLLDVALEACSSMPGLFSVWLGRESFEIKNQKKMRQVRALLSQEYFSGSAVCRCVLPPQKPALGRAAHVTVESVYRCGAF